MSKNPDTDDQPDNDPTDELPVLSEAAMAALDHDVPILADAVSSDTGEHTVRLRAPRHPGPRATVGEAEADEPGHTPSSVAALERDIAALAARWGGLEAHLDRNATAIATLSEQLAATQRALDNSNAAQQALIQQLQAREAGLESLQRTLDDSHVAREEVLTDLARKDQHIEQLQAELEQSKTQRHEAAEALERKQREDDAALDGFAQELADSKAKLAESEQARTAAETARAALETELAARDAALAAARETAAREDETRHAALAAELEQSARTVGELRAQVAEQRRRLETLEAAEGRARELQRELEEERRVRHAAADESAPPDLDRYRAEIATLSAYIENRRAEWNDLHATLAEHKTRIMELEQELAQRTEKQIQMELTVREETERATALGAELASVKTQLSDQTAALGRTRSGAPGEAELERLESDRARAAAAIEDLEARLEEQQQLLAEQRERLDAQARELEAAHAERDELAGRLADADRKDLERLSDELIDPALPVEVQSERIATLQRELSERIEALRELQDGGSSGEVVDFDTRRGEDRRAAAPSEHRFTLVCLTSDEPAAYDIDKSHMIIGRSSSSDIQILTHFVSREHARLERDGDTVSIEDLGSTNGVFVNAVRIDRQLLQHGDWVTIGETQFRFLDRRAS